MSYVATGTPPFLWMTHHRPTGPEQTRGTRPGQDPKRVATSLVLDTFTDFLSDEADVWLVKRETLESKVPTRLLHR